MRRSLTVLGLCALLLIVGVCAYAMAAQRSESASLASAKAAVAAGNYDAAEADLRNIHWLQSRAKDVRDSIAEVRKLDTQAWSNYDTAAQRFTRTATDPYNDAGPPRAMFDQVVAAAKAIVARPSMFARSDSELTHELARPAKTMFVRYITPTNATSSAPNAVRVLQIFSCNTGWGWWSTGSSAESHCNARYGATLIAFRPVTKPAQPVVLNMGNNSPAQDASITQQIIALPWHAGFALDFSGSLPASAWGCGSCHVSDAWHVVRIDRSGRAKVDGDALPSGTIADSSSGLSARGTFSTDADNGASSPDYPFNSCMACPRISRVANMKWDGDKYVVTGATVQPTAYAAMLQYINAQSSDQFTADTANFSHLSSFRVFVKRVTEQGADCGVQSDSSEISRPKIATVQLSCTAGYQTVAFTVKAVNSPSGYKLQDAYPSASNFDSTYAGD